MLRPDFQFKTLPWKHQGTEFEKYREAPSRGLLWQMRTGKTKVVIDQAAWLYCYNRIDAVLIITRSSVHANWIFRELPIHCGIPWIGEAWDAKRATTFGFQDRIQILLEITDRLPFLAINNEAFIRDKAQHVIRQLLQKRVMLVIDEVHDFRTPKSKRSKMARALGKHCVYRRILTGTNNGNSPLGNWSQFEILEPGALGFLKYGEFSHEYAQWAMQRVGGGKFVPKVVCYHRLGILQQSINQYATTIRRKDCPDLPPLVQSFVDVQLSDEQTRVYKDFKTCMRTELNDGTLMSVTEASATQMKLQQILSNFVISQTGEARVIDATINPRITILLELLDDLIPDEKVIIWGRFKWEMLVIADALRKKEFIFVEYHGGISNTDKRHAEAQFREDHNTMIFLGNPASAGLGLDLSAASTIIWFSTTPDIVIREQANERATQKGSASVAIIDLVTPGSVDMHFHKLLQQKALTNTMMQETAHRYTWQEEFSMLLQEDTI